MMRLLILSMLIIVSTGCTKPFDVESFSFNKVIVVDGLITDELSYNQVHLSYTYPIGQKGNSPLSGAEVWVESEDGSMLDFEELTPGTYQSVSQFAAETGKYYQLFFTTNEGLTYQSDKSTAIKSPPIDSIYNKYVQIALEDSESNDAGIQFFIDTHDDSGTAKYFRYEWEEYYKIVTPNTSPYDFDFAEGLYFSRDTLLNVCYTGNNSIDLEIGTSSGSSENRLAEFPIRFVSEEVDVLRNRYTLNVKQFAISESTYTFYRKLKESNESGGSLFDKQQGTITGNVTSVDNPGETVLGQFEVSGVSSLRQFFNFSDLARGFPLPSYRYYCGGNLAVTTTIDSIAFYLQTLSGYQIINVDAVPGPPAVLFPGTCTDCSWFASLEAPDFWIN